MLLSRSPLVNRCLKVIHIAFADKDYESEPEYL